MLFSAPATTFDVVAVISPKDSAIGVGRDLADEGKRIRARAKAWAAYLDGGCDETLLELRGEPRRYNLRGLDFTERGAVMSFEADAQGNRFLVAMGWLAVALVSIDGPRARSYEDLDEDRLTVGRTVRCLTPDVLGREVGDEMSVMMLGEVAMILSLLSADEAKKYAWQSVSAHPPTGTSIARSATRRPKSD